MRNVKTPRFKTYPTYTTHIDLQMTMQAGRVGDRDIRAKMAELRLITDKEIEIHQRRQEAAVLSLRKSLQSIKFDAQETVLNQGEFIF